MGVATPVKYEGDIQDVIRVLTMMKNYDKNGAEEIDLVTSIPGEIWVLIYKCSLSPTHVRFRHNMT